MSEHNLEAILAALAAQKAPATTTPQGQPPYQAPAPGYPPAQPSYQAPQPAYPYPQPTASGSLDLGAAAPGASGGNSIQEAIARAKAHAAQNGVTSYDRPINYGNQQQPRPVESGHYRPSRSRSPPPRREAYRDDYNPYRDERRADRGNQGRGYDRERSFSPRGRDRNGGTFSPRGAHGSARQRSPMRGGGGGGGGNDNSEVMPIEASLVGLIIGRQGENLRRVEGDSGCRVQFLPAASLDEQYRQCKISGPPAKRAEARAAINRIIDDSGMGPIARGGRDGGRGGPPPMPLVPDGPPIDPDNEAALQIMVPDKTVGLIIGRGGETIRDLQEKSGCHVNIVGENKSVNGLRPVNLIGTKQSQDHAKALIMEIVYSDSRGNDNQQQPQQQQQQPRHGGRDYDGGRGGGGGGGGPDKINDSIWVPSEAVGMIIGKGGETIREMQTQTGCKINVSQASGPNETEREVGLVGSLDAIQRAKLAIEDKVETVRQKNSGGGGRGGRGGGYGGRDNQRDYDNPNNYGQNSYEQHSNQNQHAAAPSTGAPAQVPAADGAADPYAAYGGYNAYLSMWYQAIASQPGGAAPGQGDSTKPPGTS